MAEMKDTIRQQRSPRALSKAVESLSLQGAPPTTTPENFDYSSNDIGQPDSGYASQISVPESSNAASMDIEAWQRQMGMWPRRIITLKSFDNAIPQQTLNRFEELSLQYTTQLHRLTRRLPKCSGISISLKVLGESEAEARPWVFVQCDRAVAKRFRNFFQRPEVQNDFQPPAPTPALPHFDIYVHERPPQLLVRSQASGSRRSALSFDLTEIHIDQYAMRTNTLCGMAIKTVVNGENRFATIGGLVEVAKDERHSKVFAMTAGHFLVSDQRVLEESLGSGLEAFDLEDMDDDEEDPTSEEDKFILEIDSLSSNAHSSSSTMPIDPNKMPTETEPRTTAWSSFGVVYKSSFDLTSGGVNFDWALIDVDDAYRHYSNIIIKDEVKRTRIVSGFEREVKILTSVSGFQSGRLSGYWAYLLLAPGKKMVKTYVLKLYNNKVLQNGDSGAWVIDSASNEVYGHVVASDVLDGVYVVPLEDVFEDMENQLFAQSVAIRRSSRATPGRNQSGEMPPIIKNNILQPVTHQIMPLNIQRQALEDPTNGLACPAAALKDKLHDILDLNIGEQFNIEKLLDDFWKVLVQGDFIKWISLCGCESCKKSRSWIKKSPPNPDLNSFNLPNIRGFLRLFAVCVLIDDPFLICWLIERKYGDHYFYCCDNPEDLMNECKIPKNTAAAIFEQKNLFFRYNIAAYLRSSGINTVPMESEQKWLMREMLELAQVMADPQRDSERHILEKGWTGDLTFRNHSGIDFSRINDDTYADNSFWTEDLSLKSFGFLLIDLIFFLDCGASGVLMLDKLRHDHPPDSWFKFIDANDIRSLYKNSWLPLGKAFDLAKTLIQPQGYFGLNRGTSYEYFQFHLAGIWETPSTEIRSSQEEYQRGSTSSSNRTYGKLSISPQPKEEEIAEAHFRWLNLYYENENSSDKGSCRIQIWRKTLKDDRLHISIFPYNDRHQAEIKASTNLKLHSGLQFVPLYAFRPDDKFPPARRNQSGDRFPPEPQTAAYRFKVQYKDRDGSDDNGIHYIFAARTREDAVQTQKALTGQSIQKDTVLAGFSVRCRRREGPFQWKEKLLSSRENSGTLQIWPVMNEQELEYIHRKEGALTRGSKIPKLRFEIALFCHDKLFVLDVKSQLEIVKSQNSVLKIRPHPNRLEIMGRLFEQEPADAEPWKSRYSGLPLFEDVSSDMWRSGDEIKCMSIELRYVNDKGRDHMISWLVRHFHAKIVDR